MNAKTKDILIELAFSLLAIIISFAIGAIVILFIKGDPIEVFGTMFSGAFGTLNNFADTLEYATPLMFTGMAVAFAFRAGLFNIGAEGQLYAAAFAVAVVGFMLKLPPFLHITVVILTALIVGGLWAYVPGVLKAKLGVHEVITTIMMNYIALNLTNYLTMLNVFKQPGQIPQTKDILHSAQFGTMTFLSKYTHLNSGIFIALIAAVIVYFIMTRMKLGYEIKVTGYNPNAAAYGGINHKNKLIIAMVISGALAGLAGAEQVSGVIHHFVSPFPVGLGFMGIAVALLGRNDPFGVIAAALLFGALSAGGTQVDTMTTVPREVIDIIQAIIILFVAGDAFLRKAIVRRLKQRKYRKILEKADV